MNDLLSEHLKAEFDRRIYLENIPRIAKCLDRLSEEEIWFAHNQHVNSIGNLILHLCGNVTQWMGSGLGVEKDLRKRDAEFIKQRHIEAERLMEGLYDLRKVTDPALARLMELEIDSPLRVQGFSETPLSILVHVIEHFSYHTGQIAQMTKLLKATDLEFYEGIDLNTKEP